MNLIKLNRVDLGGSDPKNDRPIWVNTAAVQCFEWGPNTRACIPSSSSPASACRFARSRMNSLCSWPTLPSFRCRRQRRSRAV